MLRINNIKVSLDYDFKELKKLSAQVCKISESQIKNVKLAKKSVDARKKSDIHFILSIDIEAENEELVRLKTEHPEAQIKVESSDIRVFSDEQYCNLGLEVATDMTDCDVLFGVKEIPVDALIPNKKYFFFSHTIKMQPYNRKLLQAVLEKNIEP